MNRRRILAACLAAVVVPAALAAQAGAGSSAYSPARKLAIGDAVDVRGTGIACFAVVSNKKPGIGCALLGKDGNPRPGSYAVGIAVDGTIVMSRVKADGTSATVLKRTPQAAGGAATAGRAAKVYPASPGDSFGLPIDTAHIIGCRVIEVLPSQAAKPLYRGIKVACWRATEKAPVPRSEGVEISDRFAAAFRFDAKGNVTAGILVKAQPKA